jgi:hypothetical protein
MARRNLTLSLSVPEGYTRMLESLGEAQANSHFDGEIDIQSDRGGLTHKGVTIVRFGKARSTCSALIFGIQPGVGLPLFAANILALLPPRASVEWDGAWPVFKCPPNDDRGFEDDPTPLVPDELILA